jgi:predicted glycosyltransferase
MRIWIDLANSPHVPFFNAIRRELINLGHEVEFTARDFAETVALAEQSQLNATTIGGYGGGRVTGKAGNLAGRAWQLSRWARSRDFDLAVSHNSYSQILAARVLRKPVVTLMDYEYQPANHLAFRLSQKIIVPDCFPSEQLKSYGAGIGKVRRYHGTKEDVYLADFERDEQFASVLSALGVASDHVLVLMRPPAHHALYHRFENTLFDQALEMILKTQSAKVILLPRDETQRSFYLTRADNNLIIPPSPLPGADLIAASDLVISAGGTINREAAALGIPAVSIYAGQWAAVDQMLVEEGRLKRITSKEDLETLVMAEKPDNNARRATNVRSEVLKLILE